MGRLSVITITLNEEQNIVECLRSVAWADEIIVIDSGSTDRTVDLARQFTEKIVSIQWNGYGAARNLGLAQATGDWILWLDADERVTKELGEEIRALLAGPPPEHDGYEVARRAYFLGRWIKHCGWYPSRIVRLFRKGKGQFSETQVHEQLLLSGTTGRLHHDLLHYTDKDLDQYLWKFNRYTSFAARDMFAAGRKFSLYDLLVRPPFIFFKMYILRLGFLDGMQGFILSVLSSSYVFTKYSKLWELRKK